MKTKNRSEAVDMTDGLLTIAEVAARFRVTEKTVRNWIAEGKVLACKPGGRVIRVDAHSLEFLYTPVTRWVR